MTLETAGVVVAWAMTITIPVVLIAGICAAVDEIDRRVRAVATRRRLDRDARQTPEQRELVTRFRALGEEWTPPAPTRAEVCPHCPGCPDGQCAWDQAHGLVGEGAEQ